jgi:hypothetical protein
MRLEPFVAAIRQRFPWVASASEPPSDDNEFEFVAAGSYVFVGIPWVNAERVGKQIHNLAHVHELAVFDAQRSSVALPPRLGGKHRDWQASPAEVAAFHTLVNALDGAIGDSHRTNETDIADFLGGLIDRGVRVQNRLGDDLGPEDIKRGLEDAGALPRRLQTPDRKAAALAAIGSEPSPRRSDAIMELAGWEPDPDIRLALRDVIKSTDPLERAAALSGLVRQGAVEALDDVLGIVQRDARSGDSAALFISSRAAIRLAESLGPSAERRVQELIDAWAGPSARNQPSE